MIQFKVDAIGCRSGMESAISVFLWALFISYSSSAEGDENAFLSRRKRYLAFPEGSSFSVAICMTAQTTIPTYIFTEAINWGINYNLPNDSSSIRQFLHPKHEMQRRHRRDLYGKMELIMDSMGFDGRSCIFRALCEAAKKFSSKGESLLEEIIRIVFSFPLHRIMNTEPEEHRLYHWAHRMGKEDQLQECADIFTGCSFSLLDLALGDYSTYDTSYVSPDDNR